MYYYPTHYEPRYLHPYDYYYYYHPELHSVRSPRTVVTRYYLGSPYVSSYSDGRYELLHRPSVYSTPGPVSDDEIRVPRRFSRATSLPREVRDSSLPRSRASSLGPEENLRHSSRASSVPPHSTTVTVRPTIVHYSPNMADAHTPTSSYTYTSRIPANPSDTPRRLVSASPLSFGPRHYTALSVFPTMKHSSYNLLAPIERYRYRTVPTKTYSGGFPSSSYYSYPTPTGSTASAYRQSELYPTRFQINRITSPNLESFYAGRRTLY